jgi:sugar phosphate isomerase/epimerase
MITQADRDAAASYNHPYGKTGERLENLAAAFARHREEAELRGIKLGLEAARQAVRAVGTEYTCCEQTIDMVGDAIFAIDPAAVQRGGE